MATSGNIFVRWFIMTKIHKDFQLEGKDVRQVSYVCNYCGKAVVSSFGLAMHHFSSGVWSGQTNGMGVFICPNCGLPTFLGKEDNNMMVQIPGAAFGNDVSNVPDDVAEIYDEAREAYSVGSYTGVILLCRTLLDHLAVSFGAKENQSFQEYVDFLFEHNYITINSKKWVDAIRKFGNKATHRLVINTRDDAELIITFCEMLLKSNFEYPAILDEQQNGDTDN
jgi:hypothetical protein